MSVPWIKLTTNIFDDDKIKLIDSMPEHDAILVIWIKLLTLAGRCNAGGCLEISDSMPYTEEMLAAIFNRPGQVVRLALDAFEKLGMIERHEKIMLVNWQKHQNEAALSTIRENEKQRKRLQRNKLKELPHNTCPGFVPDNVPDKSVTVRILDIDKEEDKEEKRADKPPRSSFSKPSLEEVRAYCQERGQGIDAEAWLDHYEANGWLVGKSHMKDWKAAVRTWERQPWHKPPPKPFVEPPCPLCGGKVVDAVCHNPECPQYAKGEL